MSWNKHIQKAMVDNDIKGALQLSELTGVSYERTLRLIKGSESVKLIDVVKTAEALGLEFKFVKKGEG